MIPKAGEFRVKTLSLIIFLDAFNNCIYALLKFSRHSGTDTSGLFLSTNSFVSRLFLCSTIIWPSLINLGRYLKNVLRDSLSLRAS